jgi:hypothetical protein
MQVGSLFRDVNDAAPHEAFDLTAISTFPPFLLTCRAQINPSAPRPLHLQSIKQDARQGDALHLAATRFDLLYNPLASR